MDSLLKMLPFIVRLSDDQELREQAVFTAWNAVSGAQLSGVCKPFRLYQKNLIVATLDNTWKKELERIASSMLFKLDSLLGAPLVHLHRVSCRSEIRSAGSASETDPIPIPAHEAARERTEASRRSD